MGFVKVTDVCRSLLFFDPKGEMNVKKPDVIVTCPNCGDRLLVGFVLMPSGDKPTMWTCENCKRRYYENTERTVFRPLKVGKKISGRKPSVTLEQVKVTDEKSVKKASKTGVKKV